MKRSLYLLMPAVFAFNISKANALDIDEKLTLRFLKVSSTKKTVLVNRGGEDGLVVGDHAKFFITAGVVARGVVEKVSPSRSVWSLYRVVDPNEIVDDKVLNLKIATPVKITDDPSKSLKEEAIPGGTETIVMTETPAGSSSDEEIVVNDADQDELKELGIGETKEIKTVVAKGDTKTKTKATSNAELELPETYTKSSKTWEIWGTLFMNALEGTSEESTTTGTDATSVSASGSTIALSLGAEKYFTNYNNFLKEFSVNLFVHKRTLESGDKVKSKTDWLEYGLGLNYHFYNSAAAVNRLIGYGAFTLGKGSANIESKTLVNGVDTGEPVEGSNSFFSVGVGAKYVLSNGFGVKGLLDYYSSNETYDFDSGSVERSLSGPRVQFGLSYRF